MNKILHKRQIRKKLQKEMDVIHREFETVTDAFLTQLLGQNWDDPALAEYPIFQHFNDVWVNFCNWFSKHGPGKNQLIRPNPVAFFRFAVDQTGDGTIRDLVMGQTEAHQNGNEEKPGSV